MTSPLDSICPHCLRKLRVSKVDKGRCTRCNEEIPNHQVFHHEDLLIAVWFMMCHEFGEKMTMAIDATMVGKEKLNERVEAKAAELLSEMMRQRGHSMGAPVEEAECGVPGCQKVDEE